MMTREQYLLNKLAEECNEIGQRALKAAQFGLEEIQPGQEINNNIRLIMEMADLAAVTELLNDEFGVGPAGHDEFDNWISAKKIKLEKYYQYSRSLGKVE